MKKLTGREIVLVFIAVLLAISFGSHYLLIVPWNADYAEAEDRLEMMKTEKVRMEAAIRGMGSQSSAYERRREEFLEGQNVFDQVIGRAEAELKVLRYLEDNHIEPEKTTVGAVEETMITDKRGDSAYIYTVHVNIRAYGNWEHFGRLMDQVSEDPRIRLTAFEAKEVEKGGFDIGKELSITMDMEYYMLDSQQTPGSAAGKRGMP